MSKAEKLVERLEFCRQVSSHKWIARCPAHEDRSPSLSIKSEGDRTLIHCHAGCGALDVLEAVGLDYSDLYPDNDENHSPIIKRRQKDSYNSMVVLIAEDMVKQGKRLTESEKQLVIKARLAG